MCAEQNRLCDKFVSSVKKVFARGTSDFRRSLSSLNKYTSGQTAPNKVFDEVTKVFASHLEEEFELVLDEFKLPEKFAELSRLQREQEQYKGTRAWRPSGNPAEDVAAHCSEIFKEHESKLRALLQECRAENSQLEEQVVLGRRQCDAIKVELDLTHLALEK
ncbi:unnamed protein product, partial [Ixodes hexagonus]